MRYWVSSAILACALWTAESRAGTPLAPAGQRGPGASAAALPPAVDPDRGEAVPLASGKGGTGRGEDPMGHNPNASESSGNPAPWEVFIRFAKKQDQAMRKYAAAKGLRVSPEYKEFFAAAQRRDVRSASNRLERCRLNLSDMSGKEEAEGRILWWYMLATYGALEPFAAWPPAILDLYARNIMGTIEDDCVFFAGTDPGRYVVTAYQQALQRPFHVVSQSALADEAYMNYLRAQYAIADAPQVDGRAGPVPAVQIPSADDCARAFQQFCEEFRAGKAPPGSHLKFEEGGCMQGTGVQVVMAINGILAKRIFDGNKETHAFYVEESYIIPWMYPHLRPAGMIMKIERDPLPTPQQNPKLWEDLAGRDRAYWNNLATDLANREDFARNQDAQKAFSQMRAAIAGLYHWRGMLPDAEYAYRQSLQLCPDSPEGRFRLADLLKQQRRYDEARQLMEGIRQQDDSIRNVKGFLGQLDKLASLDQRRAELQAKLAKGADCSDVMELISIFEQMDMPQEMAQLSVNMINNSNTPPRYILQLAQLCTESRNKDVAAEALRRYLVRMPQDSRGWIELGWVLLMKNQTQEALSAWQKAVETGGDSARATLRSDKRFQPVWQQSGLPAAFRLLLPAASP